MTLISAIMGTYNPNHRIFLAVESILNQDYEKLELIVYNDGSNDLMSIELLKKLVLNYPQVRYISSEINHGAAYARNQCAKIAKGDYLIIMDDDDVSSLNRLTSMIKFAKSHPDYDFYGSNASLNTGNKTWGHIKTKKLTSIIDIYNANAYVHASMLIKKSVFDSINGYRNHVECHRLEDYDLFIRLYLNGYKGINSQEELYHIYEEKNFYGKRSFKFRIREFKLRLKYFKILELKIKDIKYLFKPLVIAFIPSFIYKFIRIKKFD